MIDGFFSRFGKKLKPSLCVASLIETNYHVHLFHCHLRLQQDDLAVWSFFGVYICVKKKNANLAIQVGHRGWHHHSTQYVARSGLQQFCYLRLMFC